MTVYKNPYVRRESYFVKTGRAKSGRIEASKSKGYQINRIDGEWIVRDAEYYDKSLREMPIVGKSNVSFQRVIEEAVLNFVLKTIKEGNGDS